MFRRLLKKLFPTTLAPSFEISISEEGSEQLRQSLKNFGEAMQETMRRVGSGARVDVSVPKVAMMIDAEFIVWRKSQLGPPVPSLDLFDPRRSMDWNAMKERHIAIRTLTDADRMLTFDAIVAKYPCPERSEIE